MFLQNVFTAKVLLRERRSYSPSGWRPGCLASHTHWKYALPCRDQFLFPSPVALFLAAGFSRQLLPRLHTESAVAMLWAGMEVMTSIVRENDSPSTLGLSIGLSMRSPLGTDLPWDASTCRDLHACHHRSPSWRAKGKLVVENDKSGRDESLISREL